MKKLLSIILSVITLLSVIPVTVNAAIVTYKCGENLIWTLDTATGTLTISGEGAMANFTTGSQPWESYEYIIKNVVIESGVTTVGEHAFYDYDELKMVNIKNGSIIIEKKAFWGCNKLTSVTIGDNTQSGSGGIIRKEAFEYSRLSTVIIGNGMEIIEEYSLGHCNKLTNITLPNTLKEFEYSYIMARPTINYCGTSAEWNLLLNSYNSYILEQCLVICQDRTIYPHGECGENLTWELDSLTKRLTISGVGAMWDYSDYMNTPPWDWYQYKQIYEIIINDGVTRVGDYAFYSCTNLKKIVIGKSVETIGESAFTCCKKLSDVYYTGSKEQWDSVSIGYYNDALLKAKIHYNCKKNEAPPTCTEAGYIKYDCGCCDVDYVYEYIDPIPTGHNYVGLEIPATCTTHGYTKYECENCDKYHLDYTANPTGHALNEDGICETCGEKETTTTPVNTQMLTIESVLAMVMNLLAKIFGVFSVA